jgi:hypothetical protein
MKKGTIRRIVYVSIFLAAAFGLSYGIVYPQEEYAKRPPWETPIVEPPPPESPEVPMLPDDAPRGVSDSQARHEIGTGAGQVPAAPDLPEVGDDVTKEVVTKEPVAPPSLPDVGDDRTSEIPVREPVTPPDLPSIGDDSTREIQVKEPVTPPDLPDVGDDSTKEIPVREAVEAPDLPSIGDDTTKEIPLRQPVTPPSLPDVGDDSTQEIPVRKAVEAPDLPDVGDDVTKETPTSEPIEPPDLPDAGDDTTREIVVKEHLPPPEITPPPDDKRPTPPPKAQVAVPEITPPPDDKRPTPPPKAQVVVPEITPPPDDKPVKPVPPKGPRALPEIQVPQDDRPASPPPAREVVPPPDDIPVPRSPEPQAIQPKAPVKPPQLPEVGNDKTREISIKEPVKAPQLPEVGNDRTHEITVQPPVQPPKLLSEPPKDEAVFKFYTEFNGKWLPSVDPLVIGAKHFSTLTNMRYTETGVEGIQGYNKVNSTALVSPDSDVLDLQAGYHLSTIYDQDTYTLVHATSGDPAYGYVYENSTDIGSTGDFGDLLFSDSREALGNDSCFSAAPQRSVAYANGKEVCIWAGEEMRSSAFFVLSRAETGTLTALTWAATGDTVVDDDGYDWAANGFRPGQKVEITGTTSNNRTMTIESISGSTLTFVEDLVVNEGTADGEGVLKANIGSGGAETIIDYSDAVATQLAADGGVAQVGNGGIDSDVVLLLHMDGDSGSSTFTDSSTNTHTVTSTDAVVDVGTKKFGTGSGYFDGSSYLSISDDDGGSDHFYMGTDLWTIDFWVNCHSQVDPYLELFRHWDDADNLVIGRIYPTGKVSLFIHAGAAAHSSFDTATTTVGLSEWAHIAFIRGWGDVDNQWAITINGKVAATSTTMQNWPDLAADFCIGGPDRYHTGYIDEFRVTKGLARWTDDFTPPSRPYTDEEYNDFLVMSTRPLEGVKAYVQNPNTETSTLTGYLWSGNAFSEMTITDGTADGGIALAQTGEISFGNTKTTATPLHFRGLYLYTYLFSIDAGSAAISHVTVNAPFQKIVDIWDGVYRQPITFQVSQDSDGPYDDFTADVYETSYPDLPIGAFVGLLPASTSGGHIIAMFDERQIALNFKILSGLGNTNDAVPTVYKWDGTDWVDVELLNDSTVSNLSSWKSLESTGSYHWADRGEAGESRVNLFGVTGYAYKIEFDGALSGATADDVVIDTVTGVPASSAPKGFSITTSFGNRLLLINQIDTNEGDRIDYCLPNAPDVWNGELTSMGGYQSMYAGTGEPITAARQLFNRFGSNIFSTVVLTSDSTTHLLWGDGPEDFRIYPISFTVGCPAPKTMAVAEAGFEIANDVRRNTAFWVSHAGPVMFDGVVIASIPGLEDYFDPSDNLYLGASNIANAKGFWNSTRKEYSFIAGFHWFTYSIDRKAWFYTNPPLYPNCAFPAVGDDGRQYIYAGFDDGYMRMLDYGTTWDGATAIAQSIETGDFYPLQDAWQVASIEAIKIFTETMTEAADMTVNVYTNTEESTAEETYTYDLNDSSTRVQQHNRKCNITGWASRVKFSSSTSATNQGIKPIAWGYLARREYENSVPSN